MTRRRLRSDNGTVNTSFELFDIDIGNDFAPSLSLQGHCQSSTPGKFVIPNNTSSGIREQVGHSYGILGGPPPTRAASRRNSSGNTYNGKWLQIDINIPTTYTCSADCWWKISYEFNGVTSGNSPNDRTVWSAAFSGNPIHLVQ